MFSLYHDYHLIIIIIITITIISSSSIGVMFHGQDAAPLVLAGWQVLEAGGCLELAVPESPEKAFL